MLKCKLDILLTSCSLPWQVDGPETRGWAHLCGWMFLRCPVQRCSLHLEAKCPIRLDHRDRTTAGRTWGPTIKQAQRPSALLFTSGANSVISNDEATDSKSVIHRYIAIMLNSSVFGNAIKKVPWFNSTIMASGEIKLEASHSTGWVRRMWFAWHLNPLMLTLMAFQNDLESHKSKQCWLLCRFTANFCSAKEKQKLTMLKGIMSLRTIQLRT